MLLKRYCQFCGMLGLARFVRNFDWAIDNFHLISCVENGNYVEKHLQLPTCNSFDGVDYTRAGRHPVNRLVALLEVPHHGVETLGCREVSLQNPQPSSI